MIQDGPGEPIFVVEPLESETTETTETTEATESDPSPSGLTQLLPGGLLAFGVLILVMIMIRMLKRNLARNAPKSQGTPRERLDRIRAEASVRNPTDTYQADAEELTRRLGAIMDNKAARLELLIEEADDRLARLDRASLGDNTAPRPVEYASGMFNTPERKSTSAPALVQTHVDPTQGQIYELADAGVGPVEIAQRLDQPIGQVELILNLRRRGA